MTSEKKFRINRKKVGLTYSCPTNLDDNPIDTVHELLEFLEKKNGHCQYVVSKEFHESGKKHYHAFANYDNKLDTIDPTFFDFKGVHPNIINPGAGWVSYCRKDKDFITNLEKNPFTEALSQESVEAAVDFLWKKRPQCMAMNGDRIEKNIAKRMRPAPPEKKPFLGPYKWPDLPDDFESVILIGPSNIGKTQFAKSQFKNHCFCSHIEDLRNFEENVHDGILFDDMDFNDMKRNEQIHLTDWDEDRSIKARYGNIRIPAHTKKIFTCNTMCLDINDVAIKRRVSVIELN